MKTTNNLKKMILALLLTVAASTVSYAQCDKTATLRSSTTNHLNEKGEVEKSVDEETTITFNKTNITIAPGSADHSMTGTVKTFVCDWTTPFKVGKTVITSTLTENNEEMHATITIEGKDDKIMVTFQAEEMAGKKIQVVANKFE